VKVSSHQKCLLIILSQMGSWHFIKETIPVGPSPIILQGWLELSSGTVVVVVNVTDYTGKLWVRDRSGENDNDTIQVEVFSHLYR
jgi:hypothetical protein